MRKLVLMVLIAAAYVFAANAQVCGTVDDGSIIDRLKANKRAIAENSDPTIRSDEWVYIPIQFHIVRDNNGEGGIREDKILKELVDVNKNYAPLHMYFYLNAPFNYIDYTKLYTDPHNIYSKSWIRKNKEKYPKALNLFIVKNIGASGTGEVLGYFDPSQDVIIVKKDEFGKHGQTVSHELGHYFSLPHTFNGWEADPYDPAKHGNPLTITKKVIGNKTYIIEFMDKSNCNVAADLFCDTPPDYNFGITDPERDCKLNGPIMDYHGDTIVTMENNYMSYFFNCGKYQFTQEQQDAMRADFKSAKRKFLRTGYEPDTVPIDVSGFKVEQPLDKDNTEFYDYIKLDWSDVPTAQYYYVVMSLKSQSLRQTLYFTDKSEFIFRDGKKNKWYKWYVIPFKKGYTAAPKLGGYTFKTGQWTVATEDLEKSKPGITVFPNPLSGNQVTLKASEDFGKCKVKIYDIKGRLVESIPAYLHKGENTLNLTHSNYQNGIYNFIINTAKAKYIRKVFIKNQH